jgi:sec-independent protein translocase protein TatA
MFGLGPTELIVLLLIVLLFFGATKVPQLARSLGQGMREFRESARSAEAEEALREESA